MTKPKTQEKLDTLLAQSALVSDNGFTERVQARLTKLEKKRSGIYLAAAIGFIVVFFMAPFERQLSALGNVLVAFESLATKQKIVESMSNFSIPTSLLNFDSWSLILITICIIMGLLHAERA